MTCVAEHDLSAAMETNRHSVPSNPTFHHHGDMSIEEMAAKPASHDVSNHTDNRSNYHKSTAVSARSLSLGC